MAFDKCMYGDPAKFVRYEREVNRCYGCKHSITLCNTQFCDIGISIAKLKKPCLKWSKK